MKEEDLFDKVLKDLIREKEENAPQDETIIDHASLIEEITRVGMKTLNQVMISQGFSLDRRFLELRKYAIHSRDNYYQLLAGKGILFDNQKN